MQCEVIIFPILTYESMKWIIKKFFGGLHAFANNSVSFIKSDLSFFFFFSFFFFLGKHKMTLETRDYLFFIEYVKVFENITNKNFNPTDRMGRL